MSRPICRRLLVPRTVFGSRAVELRGCNDPAIDCCRITLWRQRNGSAHSSYQCADTKGDFIDIHLPHRAPLNRLSGA